MERIVVADWDNTMRAGFTLGDWADFLAKRGDFPASLAISISDDMNSYANKKISYDDLAHRVTDKYADGLSGKSQLEIMQAADQFVAQDRRLFTFVRPFARLLKSHGIPLVIVSGCPLEPLEAYRRALPIAKIYALTIDVVDGSYTNVLSLNPTLGDEKARIMEILIQDSNIIMALGDSKADLPLLEAAAHSVIVDNPNLTPKGRRAIHRLSPGSTSGTFTNVENIVNQAIRGLT